MNGANLAYMLSSGASSSQRWTKPVAGREVFSRVISRLFASFSPTMLYTRFDIAGTRSDFLNPRALSREEYIMPTSERLDIAHSGMCSAPTADFATSAASMEVTMHPSTARLSAPI